MAKKSSNGDKQARAAQRGAQGRHLHLQGYQCCRQVQQERLQRSPATATSRLVLPREVPKDAIYIYQGYQGCGQVHQERLQRSPVTATSRLMLPRVVPKEAIYMYKATKAVEKYTRKGCKEVRQRQQAGSCCPERCPRTPSTSTRLPRLSTSIAGKAAKKSGNGDKQARAAQRAAQGRRLWLTQGCWQVHQERMQQRRQAGSCCQESWPAFLRRILNLL